MTETICKSIETIWSYVKLTDCYGIPINFLFGFKRVKCPFFLYITELFMVTSTLQAINTTQPDSVWAPIHDERGLCYLLGERNLICY